MSQAIHNIYHRFNNILRCFQYALNQTVEPMAMKTYDGEGQCSSNSFFWIEAVTSNLFNFVN